MSDTLTAKQVLALASTLASVDGENPEYDCGLLAFAGALSQGIYAGSLTFSSPGIIATAMQVARESRSYEYTRAVAELMTTLVGGETAVVYTMLTNIGHRLPDESEMTPHQYLVMLARTRREVQAPIREGKKIHAIRALRLISTASLAQAKDVIDEVMG